MVEESSPASPHTPSDTITDEENCTIDLQGGKIIEVKCGPLLAQMHVELFLCPGIHQPCIDLNGEMISPKEFTVRASKDKQKDWKGSIRIGKSNLRTLMEMRSFDFYNHNQLCSAKCQSRNYITPKDKDCDSRRSSTASQKSHVGSIFSGSVLEQPRSSIDLLTESPFTQLMKLQYALNNNNHTTQAIVPKQEQKEELVDVDDSYVDTVPQQPTPEYLVRQMNTDPTHFWLEMQHFGLLDEIVDEMIKSLQKTREAARSAGASHVSSCLTRVATSLDMRDSITHMIRLSQNNKNKGKPRLSSDFSSLEDVDSRKRSLDDGSCNSQFSPEVKRPKVQYPAAMIPTEESKLIQALVYAQLQNTQFNQSLLMPQPFYQIGESLLGIKRE